MVGFSLRSLLLYSIGTLALPTLTPAFLLGLNIDPRNPAGYPSLANLTALGAQSVRVEFKDPTIGTPTPSAASLAFYANVVQQYPGIQVLFIIDYTTLGAFPSPTAPDSEWSTYIANFGGRAGAIAAKFKGAVDLFEVRVDALRHKSLYCQGRCKTAGGAARGHQPKLCRVPVA